MGGGDYVWPGDLPADCPPEGAAEQEILVYRFVKADPLAAADFERPIDKPRKTEPTEAEVCELCALSVFTDADDLPVARKFIPGFKKKLVAAAEVTDGHGVLEQAPTECQGSPTMTSHHNWWLPEGFDPLPLFTVVTL
jgi:hypothetical protein